MSMCSFDHVFINNVIFNSYIITHCVPMCMCPKLVTLKQNTTYRHAFVWGSIVLSYPIYINNMLKLVASI